ncbi:MAG: GAF domain-containing protein, partial [Planctomycetota bacterium]
MSTRSYRDAVADSLEGLAEHRPARRTRVDGQTNQVEALRQLSQQVSRELDTVQLAGTLSRKALEIMHACRVVVALAQAEHLQVVGEHSTRSGDEFGQEFIESLVACVASQRRHQFGDHASRHQAVLAVPILNHQSRVLGVIGFLGRPHGFYRQADLPMAESIANIAAIGFDRALLFDRMHEWTHSLESLLAFNAAVNQRLSSDGLLQKLVQHAVQFLKSKAGMAGLAVPTTQGSNEMRSTSYFLEGDW